MLCHFDLVLAWLPLCYALQNGEMDPGGWNEVLFLAGPVHTILLLPLYCCYYHYTGMADLLFSCHGWSRLPAVWPWQIKVYIVRFIPGIWISQKILGSQNPGLKKSQKSSNLVQKSGEVNYWWSCPDKSRFTKSDLFLESGYSRKSWENKILGYWDGRPAIQLSWMKSITGDLAMTNQGLYTLCTPL